MRKWHRTENWLDSSHGCLQSSNLYLFNLKLSSSFFGNSSTSLSWSPESANYCHRRGSNICMSYRIMSLRQSLPVLKWYMKSKERVSMLNKHLYLSSAWLVDPSLQVDQVYGEPFPQLIEKCQIKGHSKQGIEHTEDLPWDCAGGQIPITWKKSKKNWK